jgi:hypothetical protein
MASFFMHLSCQRKKFVLKQARRVLDLGMEHPCERAERQAHGSARHQGAPCLQSVGIERSFDTIFRPVAQIAARGVG